MIRGLRFAGLLAALSLAVPAAAQTGACGAGGARCITVSFNDVPLREVVQAFAEFSGRSIVLGDGAETRVTAEVRGQPWDVALGAIVGVHGLGVREVAPGILRIDPVERIAAARELAPLHTHVFALHYVPAEDVARVLEAVRTDRGTIAVSEATNALVVTDTEEAITTMARLIGHP